MTKPANPFRYFNSSPEVIRLVVMMYVKYPLSLRNVEDLLAERGIEVSFETVRLAACSPGLTETKGDLTSNSARSRQTCRVGDVLESANRHKLVIGA